ncbi:MAG: glycosyltransferase [Cryomorphaceae bacterium]|nr:glycosyltransferase [Cryomorphaceae bacterium]
MIQKTNILYLSYDGMTDSLGQSQVLPYLRELSKKGYSFHLVSFEKPDRYKEHKAQIEKICEESGIIWHPLTYTKKPPVLSTVFDISRMRRIALKLHRQYGFSIVHCRSYLAALVGLRMKHTKGVPFVFDMRGFWADERVDGKIWDLKNRIFRTIYRYFKKKELEFFRESAHIISLTQNGKQEITENICPSVSSEKITVIPCCADLRLFDPNKINPGDQETLRKKLGISNGDRMLGYVGSVGTWYMVNEMLELFKWLKKRENSWKFLFVTGDQPEHIHSTAKKLGIERSDVLVHSCAHAEVPMYISLVELSVFFILPAYSKKASSPTKQGELMAMGIPLICNSGVGDTAQVVNTYKSGLALEDPLEYPDTLVELIKSSFDKSETMRGAKEFYGLDSGVERYANVYHLLISDSVTDF